MEEIGIRTGKIPPIVLCVMGGLMAFTLLASFTRLDHIADEMLMMGGVFGFLFFVSGGYDILNSEMKGSGTKWE